MTFSIDRRRLVKAGTSAAVLGVGQFHGPLRAATKELRVLVGGGDWGKANIEAFVNPFRTATGIDVTAVTDDLPLSKLELQAQSGAITIDVGNVSQGTMVIGGAKGMLEPIDYSMYKKADLDALYDFCKRPFGVGALIYAYYLCVNTEKYPAGKRPRSWADFWDAKTFSGRRTMTTGQTGASGPWEEALMADGVPVDKIYPMDIERAYKVLDRMKPLVRKWWQPGSEVQQMLQDKTVDLAQAFSGRSSLVIARGGPWEQVKNQAKLEIGYWVIAKGSPNAENAQRFLEFSTRPDRQAHFATMFPEGPSSKAVFDLLPEEHARRLPSHPELVARSLVISGAWYQEKGADGKTNGDRLRERWNQWILS